MHPTDKANYSEAAQVASAGALVDLVTCMKCGATLLIDRRGPDSIELHDRFHAELEEPTDAH